MSEFGGDQKHAFKINDENSIALALKSLPKGAKALHRLFKVGIFRDDGCDNRNIDRNIDCNNTVGNVDGSGNIASGSVATDWQSSSDVEVIQVDVLHHPASKIPLRLEVVTFGILREPMDFVHRAVEAGHPRTLAVHLTEGVETMLKENFLWEPWKLVKKRTAFFWKWTRRAKQLRREEEALRSSMPLYMQAINRKKRLCLLGEILKDLHYPDVSLVNHIAFGFPATDRNKDQMDLTPLLKKARFD